MYQLYKKRFLFVKINREFLFEDLSKHIYIYTFSYFTKILRYASKATDRQKKKGSCSITFYSHSRVGDLYLRACMKYSCNNITNHCPPTHCHYHFLLPSLHRLRMHFLAQMMLELRQHRSIFSRYTFSHPRHFLANPQPKC